MRYNIKKNPALQDFFQQNFNISYISLKINIKQPQKCIDKTIVTNNIIINGRKENR